MHKPATDFGMGSLALCVLLPSLGTSIASVALPTLGQAFGSSVQQIQWVVLAYLAAHTVMVAGMGQLGDVIGRRRLLLRGIAVFTAASLACGLATSPWMLYVARGIQGGGAAAMAALALASVGDVARSGSIGSAMGLLGTASAIGTALGPSLGGALISVFGWRAIFLVNVPLGLAALLLTARYLRAEGVGQRAGSIEPRSAIAIIVRASVTALARFGEPALRGSLAASALVSMVMMATLVVGPFYLVGTLGLPTVIVGAVMSSGPIVAALAGVPAGRLVDRFGARRMAIAGAIGMAGGTIGLCALPVSWGIPGFALPLAVLTSHYSLFQAANNTAVLAGLPSQQRGSVSGLLTLSRNVGLLAGASGLGGLFAMTCRIFETSLGDPAAVNLGMRVTFAAATLGMAAALMMATQHARARSRSTGPSARL